MLFARHPGTIGAVSVFGSGLGVVLALKLGGAGFQALLVAKILYPFAVIGASWIDSFWSIPVLLLFFQFPIYAVLLLVAHFRSTTRTTLAKIAIVHLAGVVLCLAIV